MSDTPTGLALLRTPFPPNQISYLPKGGTKLAYVGHAALTDRLLDADPAWTWEPLAMTPDGLPVMDNLGGMWIRLTVCGVTRLGYGHAGNKEGGDAIKEVIGDALRNAAMRFGAALDLWHKGDLHADDDPKPEPKPAVTRSARQQTHAEAARLIEIGVAAKDAHSAALAMSQWDQAKIEGVWALLRPDSQTALTAAWPKAQAEAA